MINSINNIKTHNLQVCCATGGITSPTCERFASSSVSAPILGEGVGEVLLPNGSRNYAIFNQQKVDCFVKQRENALPYVAYVLIHSNNEAQITEMLYIFNSMIDAGVKDTKKMYPVLARFNNTTSPNIQTFLAGIYRKMQVPDAFGPLVKMLIQNSLKPQTSNFDPNEEIGGAILAYLKK